MVAKVRGTLREQLSSERAGTRAQPEATGRYRAQQVITVALVREARLLIAYGLLEHDEVVLVAQKVAEAIQLVDAPPHTSRRDGLQHVDLMAVGLDGAPPLVKVGARVATIRRRHRVARPSIPVVDSGPNRTPAVLARDPALHLAALASDPGAQTRHLGAAPDSTLLLPQVGRPRGA